MQGKEFSVGVIFSFNSVHLLSQRRWGAGQWILWGQTGAHLLKIIESPLNSAAKVLYIPVKSGLDYRVRSSSNWKSVSSQNAAACKLFNKTRQTKRWRLLVLGSVIRGSFQQRQRVLWDTEFPGAQSILVKGRNISSYLDPSQGWSETQAGWDPPWWANGHCLPRC